MKKKDEAWRHAHHGSCFDGCGELVPSGVPESFDARDWAREFNVIAQSLGYSAMDDGWLTTWFANSIMRGYDEAQRRRPASGPPSLEGVASGHVWERISGGWSLRKVDS